MSPSNDDNDENKNKDSLVPEKAQEEEPKPRAQKAIDGPPKKNDENDGPDQHAAYEITEEDLKPTEEEKSNAEASEDLAFEKKDKENTVDNSEDENEEVEEGDEDKEEETPPLTKKEAFKKNLSDFIDYLKTKNGKITASSVTGFLLLSLLIMKACEPRMAGPLYKVCHGFLEQQIEFPETISHTSAEQYPMGVRIYYTHIDGFGQYLSEYIECSFEQVPPVGLQLQAVVFNTIKEITKKTPVKNKGRLYAVEKKNIDKFNKSNSVATILSKEHEIYFPVEKPLFTN